MKKFLLILVVVFGGLYFWLNSLEPTHTGPSARPEVVAEVIPPARASIEECAAFLTAHNTDFPCAYLIASARLPTGYSLATTTKNTNDSNTFGPRQNLNGWWVIEYVKGSSKIKYTVLQFAAGADQEPNLKKVEEFRQQYVTNSVPAPQYVGLSDAIVLVEPVGALNEDVAAFKKLALNL